MDSMKMEGGKMKSTISKGKLFNLVHETAEEAITLRRKLHSFPEIMFKEHKTASLIREYLGRLEVEVMNPCIGTDTVGIIRGKHPGKTVLLRADIDALNLDEKTGVPWQSCEKGLAHSCGHDGHTTILLGAVKVLSGLSEYMAGNVKFVFQPAEEEGGGGRVLVEKGILDDEPVVDEVYALHGWPGVKEGCFESMPGTMMAAVDNFEIEVKGKGGHAAMPHLSVDPVLASAQIVTALQGIVSRNVDPADCAVVSLCSINGGELNNVIPDSVRMKGTIRYFRKEMQPFFRGRIEQIVKGVCAGAGAEYVFDFRPSYIALVNRKENVAFAGSVIKSLFGKDSWLESAPATMGGEDFAYYLEKRPGAFFRLGLGEDSPSLHNSAFDFNDNVIERGILSMCGIALASLGCGILSDL